MRFIFFNNSNSTGAMNNISTGINTLGLPLVRAGHEIEYYLLETDLDAEESIIVREDYDVAVVVVGEPRTALPIIKAFHEAEVKVVVVTDGVSQYLECRHTNRCVALLESLWLADVILVNSFPSLHYYKTFMKNPDKAHCIGFPIMADWIRTKYNTSSLERDDKLVYQGFSAIGRPYHNGWYQLMVAENMGYKSAVTALNDDEVDKLRILADSMYGDVNGIQVYEHLLPEQFIHAVLKQCGLAMYFPQRPSLGRTAAECAAVGIPCFGTKNYFQEIFFPMLTFDELSDDIPRIIHEVMNNDDLRNTILADAADKIEPYLPDNYYKTFMETIGENL